MGWSLSGFICGVPVLRRSEATQEEAWASDACRTLTESVTASYEHYHPIFGIQIIIILTMIIVWVGNMVCIYFLLLSIFCFFL